MIRNSFVLSSLLLVAASAQALECGSSDSWLDKGCRRTTQVLNDGETDIYATGYAYHLRSMYSAEKIKSFNERAWGGGVGKSLYDEDGDWHGVYAMAFLDSHKDVEPTAGYAYQKMVPICGRVEGGGGFYRLSHQPYRYPERFAGTGSAAAGVLAVPQERADGVVHAGTQRQR